MIVRSRGCADVDVELCKNCGNRCRTKMYQVLRGTYFTHYAKNYGVRSMYFQKPLSLRSSPLASIIVKNLYSVLFESFSVLGSLLKNENEQFFVPAWLLPQFVKIVCENSFSLVAYCPVSSVVLPTCITGIINHLAIQKVLNNCLALVIDENRTVPYPDSPLLDVAT